MDIFTNFWQSITYLPEASVFRVQSKKTNEAQVINLLQMARQIRRLKTCNENSIFIG